MVTRTGETSSGRTGERGGRGRGLSLFKSILKSLLHLLAFINFVLLYLEIRLGFNGPSLVVNINRNQSVRESLNKTESYSKLIVTPPKSKCVVFSIDGSFAASVSILGTDPRVRAAAVDVVRYWSDSGYLIIYISSRPDMQKNRVGQWLKQHNFPQGVTFFQKGIYHDPYSRKVFSFCERKFDLENILREPC